MNNVRAREYVTCDTNSVNHKTTLNMKHFIILCVKPHSYAPENRAVSF